MGRESLNQQIYIKDKETLEKYIEMRNKPSRFIDVKPTYSEEFSVSEAIIEKWKLKKSMN